MESICVMLSIKSDRKPDPNQMGKMIEDFWGPSQKLLGDLKFLDRLKSYDKDNIPPAVIKRIREKLVLCFVLFLSFMHFSNFCQGYTFEYDKIFTYVTSLQNVVTHYTYLIRITHKQIATIFM